MEGFILSLFVSCISNKGSVSKTSNQFVFDAAAYSFHQLKRKSLEEFLGK